MKTFAIFILSTAIGIALVFVMFAITAHAEEKVYTEADLGKYKDTVEAKAIAKSNPCAVHLMLARKALDDRDYYMYDFNMRDYEDCVHPPVRVRLAR